MQEDTNINTKKNVVITTLFTPPDDTRRIFGSKLLAKLCNENSSLNEEIIEAAMLYSDDSSLKKRVITAAGEIFIWKEGNDYIVDLIR